MKVIEKPWHYGTYLAYDETEEIFIPTERGVRVLPAPFFYDKKLYFELKTAYAPGDKATFPNGGYEVVDVSGGIRSYDLDQVIIHPQVLQHKKMLDKMARRAEKQAKKNKRVSNKIGRENKPKHGKKGRPALDPAVKAHRDRVKADAKDRSGGKRGRPKSLVPKLVDPKPVGKGKRGRPSLTPEVIAQRVSDKATTRAKSGGKRGRPRRL
jgi:hypothetical protein